MKRCTKCGRELPLERFSRNCHAPDGLTRWCKDCERDYKREWLQRRRAQYDADTLRWMPFDHLVEELCNRQCRILTLDKLSRVTGIPPATLWDWAQQPWKYCDSPMFDQDLMDRALRRAVEI